MRKVLFLLGQLGDNDVEWLIRHGVKERIAPGTVLVREGTPISHLYILLDGTLEVSGASIGKQSVRLSSGEIIGEVSFVDSRPPSATVAAASDAVVLAIGREELQNKLNSDLEFASRFYRAIAIFLARLRATVGRMGYGKGQSLDENTEYEDELGTEALDTMHMAAFRFDQVLKRLLAK